VAAIGQERTIATLRLIGCCPVIPVIGRGSIAQIKR
jgi:hypothetical protein